MFSSSFFKPILYIFLIIFFLSIFIPCFFFTNTLSFYENFTINEKGYVWPTPEYTYITSPFGKRISPTTGGSSYHKGIDIGAKEGSPILAIMDGIITFADFLGGGGYTITLSNNNIKVTYCHVSPNYIVKEGDIVYQGQIIGFVGPKYVYGVLRKYL